MYSISQKTKTLGNFDEKTKPKSKSTAKKLISVDQEQDDAIKSHLNNLKIELDKGRIKENTTEFLKFKSKNFHIWGDI